MVENKKTQLVVIAHDVDPIKLAAFPPVLVHQMRVSSAFSRERPGWGIWSTGRSAPLLPSHSLTWETKELWIKRAETIKTNYNDRYDDTCHHWRDKVLGPKSVAHSAKLERAKVEEVAEKLG